MAYIGVSPSNGVRQKHTYTATASQTTFSGAGSEGVSLSYRDSNYVDVYRNGVKLGDADYTATSGTSVVLGEGAAVSDIIEIVTYDVFSVADTVSKADGGTFDGNVAMAGTLAVTGETTLSANLNLGDNDKAIFGAGDDLQIYHDGSNSYISELGTGDLRLGAVNIRIGDNTSGASYIYATQNAEVTLYHNNSPKLATTSTGIDVTGVITTDGMTTSADINFGDNDKAVFGAGSDLQIYHDGSNSYVKDAGTGSIVLEGQDLYLNSTVGTYLRGVQGGAVTVFHNDAEKLATTSSGVDVSGILEVTGGNPRILITDSTNTISQTGLVSNISAEDSTSTQTWLVGREFGSTAFKILNKESSATIFQTGGTERMRILSGGQLVINATSLPVTGAEKLGVNGGGLSSSVAIGGTCQHNLAIPLYLTNSSDTTNTYLAKFATGSGGNTRGEIYYNGSSLVYATSSDYRLKENVNYDFDATTKLKLLKPAEYRWIEHQKDDIGFLAHEVQEVFPNAVGGEKDEVNADGSIKPQTYDPSKLVPLLVKTIQELEARIVALENA